MHTLKEEGNNTLFVTHNKKELKICDVVKAVNNPKRIIT